MPQKSLPRELQRAILCDFRAPSDAQACLQLLDTAICFLQSTGGALVQTLDKAVADMPLSQVIAARCGVVGVVQCSSVQSSGVYYSRGLESAPLR